MFPDRGSRYGGSHRATVVFVREKTVLQHSRGMFGPGQVRCPGCSSLLTDDARASSAHIVVCHAEPGPSHLHPGTPAAAPVAGCAPAAGQPTGHPG